MPGIQSNPIATLMTSSGDPCSRTVKVYLDGRARFDFVFGASSPTAINSPAYRGQGLRCAVQYRPIAGFTEPQEPQGRTESCGMVPPRSWSRM